MPVLLAEVENKLRNIARSYPASLVEEELRDVHRIAWHIMEVVRNAGRDVKLADIGGGLGLFSIGCAAVGMGAMLFDDFLDPVVSGVGAGVLELHRTAGVQVVTRDVIRQGLGLPADSMDVVTCFDSMEHWHASPKRLFAEVMTVLRPGGLFVLSGPNCVNARKRLTVPFGVGKWTAMGEWYENEVFRGHTREPDVDDFLYIARDMRLRDVRIVGRNWLGYKSRSAMVRGVTVLGDRLLRLWPALCSDLYLIGRR